MEQQLTVKREGAFSYEIVWAHDFSRLEYHIRSLSLKSRKVCVVTDDNVYPLYGNEVMEHLSQMFEVVTVVTLPAGEEHKHLDHVKKVYTHLIEQHFDRKDLLVALGGGVIGDLTGFAAATYLRGVDFVQIPTTLLAQVDSSIGGKTGVDFDQFKNMVGAFHQPRLVYMNMAVLRSLSKEQFYDGMGEVLKSALIKNAAFFQWILNHYKEIQNREPEVLASMIRESCQIKKMVVEQDPKEQGERALLNLGHTVGHAVEKLMNFQLHHGHCVAIGTVAAAHLSYKKRYLDQKQLAQIEEAHRLFYLPIRVEDLNVSAILDTTKLDKKMERGKINFILLKNIGDAMIEREISDKELSESIGYITGAGEDGK